MSETLHATYSTRAGSLVEVVTIIPDRVKTLDEMTTNAGPIWQCHGCGDKSDRPLNHRLFGNPVALVRQAAESHAATCRR